MERGCPIAGYVGFDGICYKSFTEEKTRDEARQACAADGGVLAMPRDSATNTFLANLAVVVWGRWFGLTDVNNGGQWVFEDGQNLTSSGYSNWLPGEPRPDYGKGGCVGFWEDGSFWDEKDCSNLRGFICQLQLQDYCIEESVDTEAGQVTFSRTDGGSFNYSAERCNSSEGNEKPLATRFCRIIPDSTAVWDQPVVLRCDTDLHNLSQVRVHTKLSRVSVYAKLSQIVVNNITALSVATELQVITTQAETLSSGDVSTITDILQKIVNASATEQIGESILTIADNFMKVNETVLLDSHQTDRAPTRVLQALEMFADRVDLSTDRFTSKRQDVALQAAGVSVQEFDQGQGQDESQSEILCVE
ncbi:PREDICTED: uncharacterized protein LOC109468301 [Branchiostoma belcheri]|uniref:Uncharacterized protein LOC109468301 n=1 Tax=Branchiostoma belcheri TaxID=7741 RepID=A0A6P4YCH4_BRABE|nr:PREDICTED: uncharacterized protein LOC109468301 [Branchiostoma belcheri]